MSIANQAADIENLFERALAQPPSNRTAFLDRECAGDPVRRERMERLIRFAASDDGFLERSPLCLPAGEHAAASRYAPGRLIGAYRLLRRLGAGGSAEVWLAERTEGGFQQRAAVKIIRDAQGSLHERFAVEREILASLTHPSIARLYDGGVEPDGCAYMIMEYVEGEHLGAYAEARSLPLDDRLTLFLQVCDAVAYAHTRLVVHRDIKPANILVTADGQVKLLDFGIAKLLDAELAEDATRTLHLSPGYAAPEQLTGGYVGTTTDVYALGVTLFELLTGRLPWSGDTPSLATALKRLLETPMPSPSRMAARGAPISKRALQGDLDAIVGRALRKEPDTRYPDARALADDIRRHLDHQPVQARTGARAYVLRRFLRRNWLSLAAAGAVFVAMTVGLLGIAWQAHKARLEAQRSAAVQAFMVDLFRTNSNRQSDPVKARQTTARELLGIGAKRIDAQLDNAPENKLALLRLFGDLYGELVLPSEQVSVRKQAVALSRRLYGNDSPELASDLVALASVTPEYDDTENLLAQARSILDDRNDTHSFLRGRLLAASALNHSTTDLSKALAEAEQAVSILGTFPDSVELADALYVKGRANSFSGNFADALNPLRGAIQVSISAEGAPNPMLSRYYQQLAETESYSLRHAAAEASARQAIEQARAYKAESDYDLVYSEAFLAAVLVNADRRRESLEFAAKAKADAPPAEAGEATYLKTYTLSISSTTQVRAGELDGALADAQAAVGLARRFDPEGTILAAALQKEAEALVELGKSADAKRSLGQAIDIIQHAGRPPSPFNSMLQIRLALDEGRKNDARVLFAALAPVGGDPLAATVATIQRDLVQAEIDLADGSDESAARLASEASARARGSELAPYLRSVISDGQLLEGIALTRSGEAEKACPILADAIATRVDLYLSKSPKIAEAQLALAECELAQGRRGEAANLIARAQVIEAQHSSLSQRYREPLQRLRANSAATENLTTPAQTKRTPTHR